MVHSHGFPKQGESSGLNEATQELSLAPIEDSVAAIMTLMNIRERERAVHNLTGSATVAAQHC
jgi:hypothetical protein